MSSKRIFFHGGVAGLKVGGFILPPRETGQGHPYESDDRVYMTTDLVQAVNCAMITNGRVYHVEPVGRLGPDDDGHFGPDYTARRAVILAHATVPPRMIRFEYADFHKFQSDLIELRLQLIGR
jgi:hypothetical protein